MADTDAPTSAAAPAPPLRDLTFRICLFLSIGGVIALGVLCAMVKPQYAEGVMAALSTLGGLISMIVGGRLGNATPNSLKTNPPA